MDHSLPGFSVHGILQARILEWVAMPSSRDSSRPGDWTQVSFLLLHWQTGSLPPGKPCHSTIYPQAWQFITAFFFNDTVWVILIHSLLGLPGIAATAITIKTPKTQALECAWHYLCHILLTRARHKSSPDSSDDERHPTLNGSTCNFTPPRDTAVRHKFVPPALAGGFFTTSATREAPCKNKNRQKRLEQE